MPSVRTRALRIKRQASTGSIGYTACMEFIWDFHGCHNNASVDEASYQESANLLAAHHRIEDVCSGRRRFLSQTEFQCIIISDEAFIIETNYKVFMQVINVRCNTFLKRSVS